MKKRKRMSIHKKSLIFFLILIIIFLLLLSLMLNYKSYKYIIINYLIAVNMASFSLYLFDKAVAKKELIRIPESVLITTIFFGGTAGAYFGRKIFKHKTQKKSFIKKFWISVLTQAVLIILIIFMIKKYF